MAGNAVRAARFVSSYITRHRANVARMTFVWSVLTAVTPAIASAQGHVAANAPNGATVEPQHVTIDLDQTPLRVVLETIAQRAGLSPTYDSAILPRDVLVTVHLHQVSAAKAFDQALRGTGLVANIRSTGYVAIVPADDSNRVNAEGIITGVVTDARTKRAVRGASVALDDTVKRVRTDQDGRYRFTGVASGTHTVTVRFIGSARQTRAVTMTNEQVTNGQIATADFVLEPSVNTLDQVVVTATGEQRVRELGHVVALINADSLVKSAPITNMTDLLQSRVPGLQVITGDGGMAGGEVSLRLRGTSTTLLNPEPIVIVDGVRYQSNNLIASGSGTREDVRSQFGELQSPLNDLNPNDIATIEIVKGPSASTLYGPDASNGVIVVTTKRGTPGKTTFQWYARPVSSTVPDNRISTGNKVWSHVPGGALFTDQCNLRLEYAGVCTIDSITKAPTFLSDPRFSILAKNRPTWQYGANLRGGTTQLQYYLSGNYDSQVGSLQVPPFLRQVLRQQIGVSRLDDAQETPNTLKVISSHGSISTDVAARTSLTLSANYTQTNHRTVETSAFTAQNIGGVQKPWVDTTNFSIYDGWNYNALYPAMTVALRNTTEFSKRFTTSASSTTQLFPWWSASASVGLDLDGNTTRSILPSGLVFGYLDGAASEFRRDNVGRTITLSSTALAHPGLFSFRSSAGVNYVYSNVDGTNIDGTGLAAGSTSISTLRNLSVGQVWSEMISLGVYGEEVVGMNDRLFLTGSLRLDGSKSLGDAYHPRPYPKIGLSWIASEEPFLAKTPGLHQLKLRASYGAASRYPTSTMTLGSVSTFTTDLEGQNQNVFERGVLGNPLLRPEQTRETEWGADATVLSDITLGLTWNRRRINDKISFYYNTQGLPPQYVNLGDQRSHGFEATANIPLFDAGGTRAELGMAYMSMTDKVLSLGGIASNPQPQPNGEAIGYPLAAVFGKRIIGVADTVGGQADGIILPNEVIRDTVTRFLGVTEPPKTFTLSPTLTLWNGMVRMSSLFDRSMHFLRTDAIAEICTATALCSAPFVRGQNLLQQARAFDGTTEDFLVPGDMTRWREFNVSVNLPSRFLRIDPLHLHFSNATISLQGRNLKLWTKYSGTDPESRKALDPAESIGIPQARAWSFRFDITP